MQLLAEIRKIPFWVRLFSTWCFLTLFVIAVRLAPGVRTALQGFYTGLGFPETEAIWLSSYSIWAITGLSLLFTLWIVALIERPDNWKAFLLLHRTDWPGFWLLLGIQGLIFALEVWFLQRGVWDPIQGYLIRLGLWTEASLPIVPRAYLALNILVLILVSWVEMVEEVYFRGYLQPQMTARLGAFSGITLSLLLWDVWHVWNPAMFIRRFVITIPSALIVHYRKRVWAPMLVHPLVNRLGALLLLLGYAGSH